MKKLPWLSTNTGGEPGTIPDTLPVPVRMSTIPLGLRYGLSHAHKPLRFTPEILNNLKLPRRLSDHQGSSGIITDDDDGCIYGTTTNHNSVLRFVKPR